MSPKKTAILAIDTSSPVLSIALKTSESELTEAKLDGFMKHAEHLLPLIDRLLKEKNIPIENVKTFLIGQGPGSFTGLRIGFATLKGLLAAGPIHCIGGNSLDMIAENVMGKENEHLAVCLDARRKQFYLKIYQKKKNIWKSPKKINLLSLEEVVKKLPSSTKIVGDALLKHRDLIESHFKDIHKEKANIELLPENFWYPQAKTLIHLHETQRDSLVSLKSANQLLPKYIRLSEPEERNKEHVASTC